MCIIIVKRTFNEVKGENMLTIKVYLAESGQGNEIVQDFPLYQGQYQNVLLNVFVPISILAPNFTIEAGSYSDITTPFVAGSGVEIASRSVMRNGNIAVSKGYYMRYVKTLTRGEKTYALFERLLPKEFTFYSGQGVNAITLLVNIKNVEYGTIDLDNTTVTTTGKNMTVSLNTELLQKNVLPLDQTYVFQRTTVNNEAVWVKDGIVVEPSLYGVVISGTPALGDIINLHVVTSVPTYTTITTSQTFAFNVLPSSALLDKDEPLESDRWEALTTSINELIELYNTLTDKIAAKQDKFDERLQTKAGGDDVVNAINTVNTKANEAKTIAENAASIALPLGERMTKVENEFSEISTEFADVKKSAEDSAAAVAGLEVTVSEIEKNDTKQDSDIADLKTRTKAVEDVIPAAASAANQLVDKASLDEKVSGEVNPLKVDIADLQGDVANLEADMQEVKSVIPAEATADNQLADKAGVTAEINTAIEQATLDVSGVKADVANIKKVIPKEATETNKLADKASVESSINTALDAPTRKIAGLETAVGKIEDVIPAEATESNKLADKNFVNDTINTLAAFYITKDAAGNPFATYAELTTASVYYSGGVVRTPTRNDYAIVLKDNTHDNATTRYSYQNQWEYQYTVNETALTEAQLAALNSGISAAKVNTYDSTVRAVAALTTRVATTEGDITKIINGTTTVGKAKNAINAEEAAHATNADNATEAAHATSADSAKTATSADTAKTAETANSAKTADTAKTATKATEADHATSADTAGTATKAATADSATTAGTATSATTAETAKKADSATEAKHATNADSAKEATHAASADKATTADTATNAGHAANADNATKDSAGNTITTFYEKKSDADTVRTRVATVEGQVSNILSGVTKVPKAATADKAANADNATKATEATKAEQDGAGNNIQTTYQKKTEGATKSYVKDYSLPRSFNDRIWLIGNNQFTSNPDDLPSVGTYSKASSAIGETNLFTAAYTLSEFEFELSNKNSYSATYVIRSTRTETVSARLRTSYISPSGAETLLDTVNIYDIALTANTNSTISFDNSMSSLPLTSVVKCLNGGKIQQSLYINRTQSTAATFTVYYGSTIGSCFYLNVNVTAVVSSTVVQSTGDSTKDAMSQNATTLYGQILKQEESNVEATYDLDKGITIHRTAQQDRASGDENSFADTYRVPLTVDGDLSMDASSDGKSVILRGASKLIIKLVSSAQTTGVLTDTQLAFLMAKDSNYIEINDNEGHIEKFYYATDATQNGFRTYIHQQDENGQFTVKSFTITLNVRSWVLRASEMSGKIKSYEIGSDQSLNDYKGDDNLGFYHIPESSVYITGLPSGVDYGKDFGLIVGKTGANGYYQELTFWDNAVTYKYLRVYASGVWREWKKFQLGDTRDPKEYIYGVTNIGASDPFTLRHTDDAVAIGYSSKVVKDTAGNILYEVFQTGFEKCYPWSDIKQVTDSHGNVFIKIPKFYSRIVQNDDGTFLLQISGTQHTGFISLFDRTSSYKQNYIYIGAYEGGRESSSPNRIISKPNQEVYTGTASPTLSLRVAMEKSTAWGSGYHAYDIVAHSIITQLFTIEFETTNSQRILTGVVGNVSVQRTGKTESVTLDNKEVGTYEVYASGATELGENIVGSKYHGIENPWGNVWKWLGGVFKQKPSVGDYWATTKDISIESNFAPTSGSYGNNFTRQGECNVSTNGYLRSVMLGSGKEFLLPNSVGGATNETYFCDNNFFQGTGDTVCVGGVVTFGLQAGLWCWYMGSYSYTSSSQYVGTRLCYSPQAGTGEL